MAPSRPTFCGRRDKPEGQERWHQSEGRVLLSRGTCLLLRRGSRRTAAQRGKAKHVLRLDKKRGAGFARNAKQGRSGPA